MARPRPLTEPDIIGKRIEAIYEEWFLPKNRFYKRDTIVRLEGGLYFSFDPLRGIEVEIDRRIVIMPCDLKEACVLNLELSSNEHLKSPIKAIVYLDYFMHEVGLPLVNNYVLTQFISEWGSGPDFFEASGMTLRSCIELIVADNKSY